MAVVLLNTSESHDSIKREPLIREIVKRGHQVHVALPGLDPDSRAAFAAMGATAHDICLKRTGRSMIDDLRYGAALVRLMRRIKPDLVLGFTIKPNIWGTLAASVLGVRRAMVVTGLGYTFLEPSGPRHRLVQWIARKLYRLTTARAHHIAFQNPDDLADFDAAGCLKDRSRAFLINGSGVDLQRFRPSPVPEEPVFLMPTRLIRGKGVAEFAQAASLVRARVPEARFLLAGRFEEGPDAITKEEIDAWDSGDLDYVGFMPDIRPLIERSSVVVLPSWREGTPRSLLEAMAMGRPVITTDAPGCRETTIDGVNGRLVPVRDPHGLAHAMIELAEDPELRRRMGAAGRKIAEERYSADAVNESLLGRIGL